MDLCGRGRKDDWTKTSYIKLENAEKELQRMMKSSAFKLAQGDEEDEANTEENSAPYREAQRAPLHAFEYTGSQKKHSFPTIAHNYTFWADLIFEPRAAGPETWCCLWRGQAGGVGATLSRTRVQST